MLFLLLLLLLLLSLLLLLLYFIVLFLRPTVQIYEILTNLFGSYMSRQYCFEVIVTFLLLDRESALPVSDRKRVCRDLSSRKTSSLARLLIPDQILEVCTFKTVVQ